jgi:hypothetical protein
VKLGLSVKSQSVETSGITKDYKEALCEYIWNGFEANATRVELSFVSNELGGVAEVIIRDNGDGIDYFTLEDTFGAFLASQKSGLSLQLKSKANKGKGRFSFLAFASNAKWETVCKGEKHNLTFSMLLDNVNKNECEVTEPSDTNDDTGTDVTITGIDALKMDEVSYEALEEPLLQVFAWYLYLNKNRNITLVIDGTEVDYSTYINADMSLTKTIEIEKISFIVTLIVWAERIKENFCTYYLDDNSTVCGKDTTTFNRNTVNFNHSVFVKSSFFNSKSGVSLTDVSNEEYSQTAVEPIEEENAILHKLKKAIQDIISKSLSEHMSSQADRAVQDMIERKSFPVFSTDVYGEIRKHDLVTVTKELYRLDSRIFYKLKPLQEKSFLGLLNLLLSSEERENVLSIVESIVDLSPQQRAAFASILKKTRLENIVTAIKFIEERFSVIEGLRALVFDNAKYANERDNIQKIIEQHYWLFGEQYHLVTADQRMQKALQEYLYILYGDAAPMPILEPSEEERRRMDVFACGVRKTENGFETPIEENLIVELKAPEIVLSKKVLRQIEDYMDYIRKQPLFNSQYRRWKFIAVCREVDEDVKSRYTAEEAYGKKGLVTKIDNYEVYALTWDDVFKSFDLSHGFILDKLRTDRVAIADELKKEIVIQPSKAAADQLTDKICSAS